MNLDRDDEKLEAYLKQFQARAPRPLPVRRRLAICFRRPAAFMAAAATILVALTLFLLKQSESRHPRVVLVPRASQPIAEQISVIRLSRLAQQDPEKLGSHLDRLSRALLPDVQKSKGVLKQLARE